MMSNDFSIGVFVDSIFNHPVATPEWYWTKNWDEPDFERIVIYLDQFHKNPAYYLKSYNDHQIEQGMQFILSAGVSDCHRALCLPTVNLENRISAVFSIMNFFENIYNIRCTDVSTFSKSKITNPLNQSCFMWWDISPLIGCAENEIIEACLNVMDACLFMSNVACQESALHGLGHLAEEKEWEYKCKKIIDNFLGSNNKNISKLESYAKAAYQGYIQ